MSARAMAVERAGSLPASPIYQDTVLLVVPSTSAVAVSNGGPATRCGGWPASTLKKSSPAACAEAAVSAVPASVPSDWVRAARRLVAVAVGVPPMVNSFGPGVAEAVAVSVRSSLDPSGSVNENRTVSPAAGLVAPKSMETAAGEPAVSSGERDKLVESFGWSLPSERHSGATVESPGEVVELFLGEHGQVGALG